MNEKKYTKDHEWVFLLGKLATVGITDYAQQSLGDIVFVELPEIGKLFTSGDQVGVIESVKAASEIYCPVSGKIIEVNKELVNSPQLINTDPENSGWCIKIEINNTDEINNLLSLQQYKELI